MRSQSVDLRCARRSSEFYHLDANLKAFRGSLQTRVSVCLLRKNVSKSLEPRTTEDRTHRKGSASAAIDKDAIRLRGTSTRDRVFMRGSSLLSGNESRAAPLINYARNLYDWRYSRFVDISLNERFLIAHYHYYN